MRLLTKRGDILLSGFGNIFDDFSIDKMRIPSQVGNSMPAVNISEENEKFQIEWLCQEWK